MMTMTLERRGRLRRLLHGDAPPSLRATLFLSVSTFLCGCVVASLLFVGVWRHTAGEAAQSKAAVAHTQALQLRDKKRLLAVQSRLAALQAQLAQTHVQLRQAKRQAASAKSSLSKAQAANRALLQSLAPRLQALADTAASLAHTTTTIESELGALATYAQTPGGAGLDPGYLASQTRYIARVAAGAAAAAAALEQDAQDAQAAAHT
jgi:hypothetical protein